MLGAMPITSPSASLEGSIDSARAYLADASDTLRRVGLWLSGLADDTRWESPAARAFHAAVGDLHARTASLGGRVRDVQATVDHARAVLAVHW